MKANELAEIIEHLENARYIGASKAAEMLRQQQAEIEALKKVLEPWVMYVDEFAKVPPETWQKFVDCAKLTSEWKKK